MNIKMFKQLWSERLLGFLYCENGEAVVSRSSREEEMFNVSFDELCPLIFKPLGQVILDVSDIKIFGSMIKPRTRKVTSGFWKWKKTRVEKIEPNDIDIAVITKRFESKFIIDADLVETYDMGIWLVKAGIDLIHIPKARLKERNSVAASISKGLSIFDKHVTWEWNAGKMDCVIPEEIR